MSPRARSAPTPQPPADAPPPWLLPVRVAQRPSQRRALLIANGGHPVRDRRNSLAQLGGVLLVGAALATIAIRGCS